MSGRVSKAGGVGGVGGPPEVDQIKLKRWSSTLVPPQGGPADLKGSANAADPPKYDFFTDQNH